MMSPLNSPLNSPNDFIQIDDDENMNLNNSANTVSTPPTSASPIDRVPIKQENLMHSQSHPFQYHHLQQSQAISIPHSYSNSPINVIPAETLAAAPIAIMNPRATKPGEPQTVQFHHLSMSLPATLDGVGNNDAGANSNHWFGTSYEQANSAFVNPGNTTGRNRAGSSSGQSSGGAFKVGSYPYSGSPVMPGFMENDDGDSKSLHVIYEKKAKRRASHNAVERRRRDNINERIYELYTLLPEFHIGTDPNAAKPNKGQILKKSVEYTRQMQSCIKELLDRNNDLENIITGSNTDPSLTHERIVQSGERIKQLALMLLNTPIKDTGNVSPIQTSFHVPQLQNQSNNNEPNLSSSLSTSNPTSMSAPASSHPNNDNNADPLNSLTTINMMNSLNSGSSSIGMGNVNMNVPAMHMGMFERNSPTGGGNVGANTGNKRTVERIDSNPGMTITGFNLG
ncbi:hypothetical protein BKA69DRAFT_239813 [Paraphysoderma sedebokerense]|nr:hypothetical protein BKA69DRAFT_239813 [Paraphysoderma sedebokerense]